jgi:hypothetical protein
LGGKISYEEVKEITSNISKFLQIDGILDNDLIPHLVPGLCQLKAYNILTIPLIYKALKSGQ